MLRILTKVANRLDLIGLNKEADNLDAIIKKIAQIDFDFFDNSINRPGLTIPMFLSKDLNKEDIIKMISDQSVKDKDLEEIFKNACNDYISLIKENFPEDVDLYYFNPMFDTLIEKAAEIYGEDLVEDLAIINLPANPRDFIQAAIEIKDDKGDKYFPESKIKKRAAKLEKYFEKECETLFNSAHN